MKQIKILGAGCPKCRQLHERVADAAEQLGAECEIEKITQLDQIMEYGVAITPGLVIDGEVRATGKLPGIEEIKAMLQGA